ncbi:MAG TPA: M1 family peptidase, partial [Gemmatimonadaceae bacterium]|nr:M1 family peptidase [Gemmatimonadaceae bacterium]
MRVRSRRLQWLLVAGGAFGLLGELDASAQRAPGTAPGAQERAIRRDIPLTNAIRRAMAAATRDSTGRPGRNYWQLWTDYQIDVRLDTASSRLYGREVVTVRNDSPDTLRQIGLRLDMNLFLWNAPRAAPWAPAEITDGMVISRMAVDGTPVNLAAPQGGRGAPPAPLPNAIGLQSTVARINLATPVPPRASTRLEIEWNHKVPGGPGSGHRMTQRWGDTLYQPTQWYPRVAVYDDLRGWDSELYLGPSEFYNNFGRFDVRIDVPAGWIVSGTGILQNPEEVLTARARARLARVLESDTVMTIVGSDELGPGRSTAAGERLVWRYV